jgi:hypothetical protein
VRENSEIEKEETERVQHIKTECASRNRKTTIAERIEKYSVRDGIEC